MTAAQASTSLAAYAVALAAGAGVSLLVRGALHPSRRLTRSVTMLCGVIGSVGGFAALKFVPALTHRGFPWLRLILAAGIGAVVVVAAGRALRTRWERTHPDLAHPDDVTALIAAGEGARLEFKSSARWNLRTGGRDERLELVIAKTVAAFANARGGTLLIGVDDEGRVIGLENDFKLLRQGDRDRYELWLHDLIGTTLGRSASQCVNIRFACVQDRELCRVDVAPAAAPLFLSVPKGSRTADFYLRVGNSTRHLLSDEVLDYAATRWPSRPLARLLWSRVHHHEEAQGSAAAGAERVET